MAQASADDTPMAGEIEVDESYFGGVRKGKRGRGAAASHSTFRHDTPVFACSALCAPLGRSRILRLSHCK